MPKSKNPKTRLKLIYEFICKGYEPGKKMILKHLVENGITVSEKTVVNDLKELKLKNSIKTSGAGRSVEYLPVDKLKSIEFENDNFNYDDMFSLQMALLSLQQLKFFNLSQDLKNVILKIEKEINKESKTKKEIVNFQNAYLKIDPDVFQYIFEATSEEKVILIEYKSFKSKQKEIFNFHPFFLKQFNNRWFVIGYREDEKVIDHLGIERVLRIKILNNEKYNFKKYITPTKYSQNLFGVSKENNKLEKIELLFSQHRAPYFISKPIVKNITKKKLKTGMVNISFNCIINKELIAELLSFGNDIEVLKPTHLREKFKSILEEAVGRYN